MPVWINRAGARGEYEEKFVSEQRVYITRRHLQYDLSKVTRRQELIDAMSNLFPKESRDVLHNWVRQVWPFAHEMKKGDLVVLPLKSRPVIYVGNITGDYTFEEGGPDPFFHWRAVQWVGEAIPRTHFGRDLQLSFGAFLTVYKVQRNNAEDRIRNMLRSGWKAEATDVQLALSSHLE